MAGLVNMFDFMSGEDTVVPGFNVSNSVFTIGSFGKGDALEAQGRDVFTGKTELAWAEGLIYDVGYQMPLLYFPLAMYYRRDASWLRGVLRELKPPFEESLKQLDFIQGVPTELHAACLSAPLQRLKVEVAGSAFGQGFESQAWTYSLRNLMRGVPIVPPGTTWETYLEQQIKDEQRRGR